MDNLTKYSKLKKFIHYTRWMEEQDLDVFGIVSAPKGFGKSVLIIQILRLYLHEFGLHCQSCDHYYYTTKHVITKEGSQDFSKQDIKVPCPKCDSSPSTQVELRFEDVLAYDNPEVRRLIREAPLYGQIMADEGVEFAMAEDWNKAENKATKSQVAQMRPKHLSLWMAVQKFKWIDSKYRDDMTTFWIRILRRGLAVVLEPDLGEYGDSFHLDDFTDLLGSYNYRTSKSELRRRANKIIEYHPCGFDKISWPDCPDSIYDEYLELRNEKAFEKKAASDFTQKDLAKLVAWNLSQRWEDIREQAEKNRSGDMTLRTLASEVFQHPVSGESMVSPGTLSKWNSHVREET